MREFAASDGDPRGLTVAIVSCNDDATIATPLDIQAR